MTRGGCRVAVAASLLALVGACEQKAAPPRRAARATEAKGAGAPEEPCVALKRELGALLSKGGVCGRDSDCECYPPVADCGGATDQATGRRLRTLLKMFRLAQCAPPSGCAPAQAPCRAQCVAGRCRAAAHASSALFVGRPGAR